MKVYPARVMIEYLEEVQQPGSDGRPRAVAHNARSARRAPSAPAAAPSPASTSPAPAPQPTPVVQSTPAPPPRALPAWTPALKALRRGWGVLSRTSWVCVAALAAGFAGALALLLVL